MAESLQQENLHRVICLFSLVALNCISIYSPMLRPCWAHAAPMLRPPGVPSPPKNVAEKSLEKRDGRLEFVKDILGIFRGHLQAAQVWVQCYGWPGASLRGEALKAGVSIFIQNLFQVINSAIKVQTPTMKTVANRLTL